MTLKFLNTSASARKARKPAASLLIIFSLFALSQKVKSPIELTTRESRRAFIFVSYSNLFAIPNKWQYITKVYDVASGFSHARERNELLRHNFRGTIRFFHPECARQSTILWS
jgi:hypothetical protein